MEKIYGVITKSSVDEGIGKNGKPYKRYVIEMNGKKYSTFDDVIGARLKVGENVCLNGEMNGPYFNMKSVEINPQTATPSEKSSANSSEIVDVLRLILAEIKGISAIIGENAKSNTAAE